MATVIKIGNIIQKHASKQEVSAYLTTLGEDWKDFVSGELKRSNDTNNKSLGDQRVRNSMDDEDNDKDYEMNMEKIMAKFSNFNVLS
jgi:hypothetical protein